MNDKKIYWKGIEELKNDPIFLKYVNKEFPKYLPVDKKSNNTEDFLTSRRDFLKIMGFSIAATSLFACEAPIRKAIPYLNKPVDIDPGIPNYYASTYNVGGEYCSLIVKTREGRPIKLQGNALCPINHAGMNVKVEASILSLYDEDRLNGPKKNNKLLNWKDIDKEIIYKLSSISKNEGQIRIVSNTILSPSTKSVISIFAQKYNNTKHVVYDSVSCFGIREANNYSFQQSLIPSYNFSKANVIVSFSADFLGTWVSPIEFNKQYTETRKIGKNKKTMSRHYQFESNLSVTGSNADYRFPTKPSEEDILILHLYNLLAEKSGSPVFNVKNTSASYLDKLPELASELWSNRGSSLVVSGSNKKETQILINSINYLLNNYGETVLINNPVNSKSGNDENMDDFIKDLELKKINAVIFLESNPVYDHPRGRDIAKLLLNVDLKISTNDRVDETSFFVNYLTPNHHYLESWNDVNPKFGLYTLVQPAITPLFNTRQSPESLLVWSNYDIKDYYTFIRNEWKVNFFKNQSLINNFQKFWDQCLFKGVYKFISSKIDVDTNNINLNLKDVIKKINFNNTKNSIDLCFYEKVAIGSGNQSNNPWLHELPDPISKACWDNYLTISQDLASEYNIEMARGYTKMANLNVGNKKIKVPVLVQPGQAKNTIGIALGYGRERAGKVANGLGVNVFPLITKQQNNWVNYISNVTIEPLDEAYRIAQTQTHQTYMGRKSVIQESTLSEYQKNPSAGRYYPKVATSQGVKSPKDISLWKGHKYPNHHWGLVVDLNTCTGCSVCVVACQVENNIPVVGKDEVLNRREMHWIRIDRYYTSDADPSDSGAMEQASSNPDVIFQPIMCQHCNNASCETVCPVLATTHSSEGLNQMTYNRCIGTRYCANNCPYKVRRFNWFKYHDNKQFKENTAMNNDLGKMVLNPDVTVRARGVMEKCTMCIHTIQAGKLQAKMEKRKLVDGDIDVACSVACPTDAIIFGDMNDKESKISKLLENEVEERAYHILEEISVKPNVAYLTKIKNKK